VFFGAVLAFLLSGPWRQSRAISARTIVWKTSCDCSTLAYHDGQSLNVISSSTLKPICSLQHGLPLDAIFFDGSQQLVVAEGLKTHYYDLATQNAEAIDLKPVGISDAMRITGNGEQNILISKREWLNSFREPMSLMYQNIRTGEVYPLGLASDVFFRRMGRRLPWFEAYR